MWQPTELGAKGGGGMFLSCQMLWMKDLSQVIMQKTWTEMMVAYLCHQIFDQIFIWSFGDFGIK